MSKTIPLLMLVAGAGLLYWVTIAGQSLEGDDPGALPPLQGESIAGPILPVEAEDAGDAETDDPFSLMDDVAMTAEDEPGSDTGASDTGASDTGASDTGASDTGASDTADEGPADDEGASASTVASAERPAPQRLEPTVEEPSVGESAAGESAVGAGSAPDAGDATEPDDGSARLLTWEEIAFFEYEPPDVDDEEVDEDEDSVGKADEQIPAEVRALDGKVISVEGYMMPLEVKDGKVMSFILARHVFGCCFGVVPKINEWVAVEVADEEGAHAVSYDTVLVTGHLKVGGVMDEFGYMFSIYQILDGEVSARR